MQGYPAADKIVCPMKFKTAFAVFCLFFILAQPARAIVDPLAYPNNKFGIHITDENDLYDAERLVNSSGGDWGYVTIVIQDTDRNRDKWQNIFDQMRGLHLIPIIRLATHPQKDVWVRPSVADAQGWAEFLNSLYWVSKNRYVVLFNEPNHTSEWGGSVDPKEYGRILSAYSAELKKASADFFVLPAGLDSSAPNSTTTVDEQAFLTDMLIQVPDALSQIDGWTSHSYPNPGFVGKVTDSGRGTLKSYLWELDLLTTLKQNARLPVFITETGWPHKDGVLGVKSYYSAAEISAFIKDTASLVWNDPQIAAITPFILNYQSVPLAAFSWKREGGRGFYDHYYTYQSLTKTAGRPGLNSVLGNFHKVTFQNIASVNTASGILRKIPVLDMHFWRSLFYHLFKL